MIDMYYFFDKSTKRKAELADYCTFCDIEFRKILKHVSTRWLSLETAVSRTLQQYPALKSMFLCEGILNILLYSYSWLCSFNSISESSNARASRLSRLFSDPMTEVYLLFYQATMQIFVAMNKFLQREDPIISVLNSQMATFVKKLLGRFVIVRAIQEADNVCSVDYLDTSNQLCGK